MKHILVIDSSQVIRTTCQIHLEQAGYTVLTFATYEEAFKQLPRLNPPPDLMLVELYEVSPNHRRLVNHLQEHPRYAKCRLVLLWRRESARALPRWLTRYEFLPTPFFVQYLLSTVQAPQFLKKLNEGGHARHE